MMVPGLMNNLSQNGTSAENMDQMLRWSVAEAIGMDRLDKVIDRTMTSVAGNDEVTEKGTLASSLRSMRLLQVELEQAYGHRVGQGFALQAGRYFFNHAMRSYGGQLGFTSNAFLLKSMQNKMEATLHAVAGWFNQFSDHQVIIEPTEQSIYWRSIQCPFCWDRKEQDPICHFTTGVLQQALYWVSGGKIYPVDETACLACGDPECLIVIGRTPLE